MISYICKYTPVELIAGFGESYQVLDEMPENFDLSDEAAHANLCGFGKSVIRAALARSIDKLILVNCCDTIRRAYDIISDSRTCAFVFLLDLPHDTGQCAAERFSAELRRLKKAYATFSSKEFDWNLFFNAFNETKRSTEPFVGILGVLTGKEMEALMEECIGLPVRNFTCVGNRSPAEKEEELLVRYAESLLSQISCCRMSDTGNRRQLFNDPGLQGIIYHTIKFCDFYGFEYSKIKDGLTVPVLKI